MGWNLFNKGKIKGKNYEIKTSKSGDNYFCAVIINDEPVMMIVSPPTNFKKNIGGGGEVNPVESQVGMNFHSEKQLEYNKPYVLFNKNNHAQMELTDVLSEVNSNLQSKDPDQNIFKAKRDELKNPTEIKDISSDHVFKTESSIIQMHETDFVLRPHPNLTTQKMDTIRMILEYGIHSLFPKNGTFRANVMMFNPETNTLKIQSSYNMSGDVDEHLEISVERGGAGTAFRENMEQIVDLNLNGHKFWKIDSSVIWSKMQSFVSFPIPNSNNIPLAVLNIDSNLPYTDAGFKDEKICKNLRRETQIIGKIMEYM